MTSRKLHNTALPLRRFRFGAAAGLRLLIPNLTVAALLLAVFGAAPFIAQTPATGLHQAPAHASVEVAAAAQSDVARATLDNGLKVVVVRNSLAPVVTVEQNYLVGGNETPEGFPGMAHAQEHMAFRGCASLTADQLSTIFAQLGGANNADTEQNITQYFETVPAADLDIALRVDADCMPDIQDSQPHWHPDPRAL